MAAGENSKTLFVVACALLDGDGRALLAQRPADKSESGKWEFPGGKIKLSETPQQALQRELREELLVEPCLDCFEPLGFATSHRADPYICLMLFACRRWDGFVAPQEGQSVSWVVPTALASWDLCALDRYLVDTVGERIHGRRVC